MASTVQNMSSPPARRPCGGNCDFGAIDRLFAGFVVGCELEEEGQVRLLPDALAPAIAQMMERGAQALRPALTPPARSQRATSRRPA